MRPILIGLLLLSSCAYQTAQTKPFIKVVSEDINFYGHPPKYTAKGKLFIANISHATAFSATVQIVFMTDSGIIDQVEKTFYEPIYFDQVKEFNFEKELFLPTEQEIKYSITTWSQ